MVIFFLTLNMNPFAEEAQDNMKKQLYMPF